MIKKIIENYKSPNYLDKIKIFKKIGEFNQELDKVEEERNLLRMVFNPKSNFPDLRLFEKRIKDLSEENKYTDAIILALEYDEYKGLLGLNPEFLYIEPIIEKLHRKSLEELDFDGKMQKRFQYLYESKDYSFDREGEKSMESAFDSYILFSNLREYFKELKSAFEDSLIFKNIELEQLEKTYTDYLAMQIIINQDDNLTEYIKSLDSESKLEYIENDFYNTNENIIANNLDYVTSQLTDDLDKEFLKKLISDSINNKNNQLAYFLLQHLPKLLSKKAKREISKARTYRDLFQFFQITHPFECLDEETWDIRRGDKVLQTYKNYQVDKVKSLLGL